MTYYSLLAALTELNGILFSEVVSVLGFTNFCPVDSIWIGPWIGKGDKKVIVSVDDKAVLDTVISPSKSVEACVTDNSVIKSVTLQN